MISAKIILRSVGPNGIPITSYELTYPRFILAEVNTHRALSKSSSSSRAIPVARMLADVAENPAMPVHWGKNQPGMQADGEIVDIGLAIAAWRLAARDAMTHARALHELGVHKQVANRLLEPFQWTRTIVTGTEWDNLWELRDHPDAQPEFRALVQAMRRADGPTQKLRAGEWHMPYTTDEDPPEHRLKISVARCARVSYLRREGASSDRELYSRLIESKPAHMSPCEHQARALSSGYAHNPSRNFKGWLQHREAIERGLMR